MIKATVDTNILVSSLITHGNEFQVVELARQGIIKIILSYEILEEFKDVISRPKFKNTQLEIYNSIINILSVSSLVIPKERLDKIKDDPSDNRILECALQGNVDYIVSGDKHLLNIKKYRGKKIIKAEELLKIIKD